MLDYKSPWQFTIMIIIINRRLSTSAKLFVRTDAVFQHVFDRYCLAHELSAEEIAISRFGLDFGTHIDLSRIVGSYQLRDSSKIHVFTPEDCDPLLRPKRPTREEDPERDLSSRARRLEFNANA